MVVSSPSSQELSPSSRELRPSSQHLPRLVNGTRNSVDSPAARDGGAEGELCVGGCAAARLGLDGDEEAHAAADHLGRDADGAAAEKVGGSDQAVADLAERIVPGLVLPDDEVRAVDAEPEDGLDQGAV